VLGKIDEGSTLLATKVRGSVHLRGKVDGASRVVINAPEGSVAVSDHAGKGKDAARVTGGSKLTATAKVVTLAAPVTGAGTVVELVITPKGMLTFVGLEDAAVLRYRPEHRADPPLRVTRGPVTGGAELKEDPAP
jgi:hypothetical protein